MDHPDCETLRNLCVSIRRSHDVIDQVAYKSLLVDHLLNVLLACTSTHDDMTDDGAAEINRRNSCSNVPDDVGLPVRDVMLERSTLYADSALYDSGKMGVKGHGG